jgi:putative redox protein
MRVQLHRLDNAFHFQGNGSSNIPVNIDGASEIGGNDKGVRPMELLLMGLGSCSAIDIIQILKKQRQAINGFEIIIDSERQNKQIPALFKWIHIKYILTGKLDKKKVERAIRLSFDKYCSVSAILSKTAKIEYSFEIVYC